MFISSDKEVNEEKVNDYEIPKNINIFPENTSYITREELLEILNEKSAEYKDIVYKTLNDYNKKDKLKEIIDIPEKKTNIEF